MIQQPDYRRFKSLVGQSMFQYLTSLRMQKAMELRLPGSWPVPGKGDSNLNVPGIKVTVPHCY